MKAWHRHYRVKCSVCHKQIWPRITCITRTLSKAQCCVPKVAVCAECRHG